jgi:hypothetical protein
MAAIDQYQDGSYLEKHPDWHLQDSALKAQEILPLVVECLEPFSPSKKFKIAEFGAGTGAVLYELGELLCARGYFDLELVAFEISEEAIAIGQGCFTNIVFDSNDFLATDKHFDIVMFIDVLEHLESPDMFCRHAISICESVVVRQPLENTIFAFVNNKYPKSRAIYGHINYYNLRSFSDFMLRNGWFSKRLQLRAPYERLHFKATGETRMGHYLIKLVAKISPAYASFIFNGFLLLGLFSKN